jgi:hypothetical protein
MILGLSAYAWVHTLLSLVAIVAGFAVLFGLFDSRRREGWAAIFLATAALTSATGFGFAFTTFRPSHWIGAIALVLLVPTILAFYLFRLAGVWRLIYTVGAVANLFFLVFVLIAQLFLKIPSLHALAPTQSEPAFAITQLAVTVIFVFLAILTAIRFRPAAG